MTSKKDLSRELCEICGIKPKTILLEIYPDFEQPENFVKLLELKILTGATLWGWLSAQGVFMSQRKTVLKTIYLILSRKINFCNKLTLEQIKQSIRETEWVYE